MGYRISSAKSDQGLTVRFEGRLDAAAIPDLRAACVSADAPLRLELSGLMSADEDGVRVLRSLTGADTELMNMSPYIRQLLFGISERREDGSDQEK